MSQESWHWEAPRNDKEIQETYANLVGWLFRDHVDSELEGWQQIRIKAWVNFLPSIRAISECEVEWENNLFGQNAADYDLTFQTPSSCGNDTNTSFHTQIVSGNIEVNCW